MPETALGRVTAGVLGIQPTAAADLEPVSLLATCS